MNISEAAKRSGVSSKMIRHYEKVGLIPSAARSASNYRQYTPEDVHVLQFIGRARDLGFSVHEIGSLLSLWRDQSRHSADVRRLAQEHLHQLRDKIRSLEEIARTVEELVEACHGDERPNCPILDNLRTKGDHVSGPGRPKKLFGVK